MFDNNLTSLQIVLYASYFLCCDVVALLVFYENEFVKKKKSFRFPLVCHGIE